jgi:hypothetical protein
MEHLALHELILCNFILQTLVYYVPSIAMCLFIQIVDTRRPPHVDNVFFKAMQCFGRIREQGRTEVQSMHPQMDVYAIVTIPKGALLLVGEDIRIFRDLGEN